MDPSMTSWGIAKGTLLDNLIQVNHVQVVNPVLPTGKQVRQNSKDLVAATQLFKAAYEACRDADAVFVEVPVGSQSARAMASYAMCVGVLGAMRSLGIKFFEVTPTEVKLAGPGIKDATKAQMIQWAMAAHPQANWPMHNGKVSATKAEHCADAASAIHAGVQLDTFNQLLSLLKSRAA
jgi:hypothetical protein